MRSRLLTSLAITLLSLTACSTQVPPAPSTDSGQSSSVSSATDTTPSSAPQTISSAAEVQPPASSSAESSAACKVGGCGGEICTDTNAEDMVTPCIWSPSFACYRTARCEPQRSGHCGWSQTPELQACLAKAQGADENAPQ